MNGYICYYNGKQTELYAESLYAAKVKASAFFKAPHNKQQGPCLERNTPARAE